VRWPFKTATECTTDISRTGANLKKRFTLSEFSLLTTFINAAVFDVPRSELHHQSSRNFECYTSQAFVISRVDSDTRRRLQCEGHKQNKVLQTNLLKC
jgi:hypothetical protein